MSKIEWHDGLNLGVEEIDDQHKELVSMINDLLISMKNGANETAVDDLLGQLREYTVYHFNSEEEYMEKVEYPAINEHKQVHRELKKRVKMLQSARFHKENVDWVELKSLLSEWLIQHILHEDFKIAQYVKSGGGKGWDS